MFQFMVFNYILQKGFQAIRSIDDQDVENLEKKLKKEDAEATANGKIMIMTPEFQVDLVNEARRVCNKSNDYVMKYIKVMSKKIA